MMDSDHRGEPEGRELPEALDEPEELRRHRSFIRGAAPQLADDFLDRARQTRASRDAKGAEIAEEIAHIWARGWTVFDAVIYAMEQSAALMFARTDLDDEYAYVREAPPAAINRHDDVAGDW